jgi:hypothetical protein
MKTVKFITHYSLYMPGEYAQFPAAEADLLVKRRAAVMVVATPTPVATKKATANTGKAAVFPAAATIAAPKADAAAVPAPVAQPSK